MSQQEKWEEIADALRQRIIRGELKPGDPFPTTLSLMREFNAHSLTIHLAVQALINEGLIHSPGKGRHRRTVRPLPERSVRRGGFLAEFGDRGTIEILDLADISLPEQLPDAARGLIETPALRYHTRQWRDRLPVALSDSYLPGHLPVDRLKTILSNPTTDLYEALKQLGFESADCEESLVARPPTPDEAHLLHLPVRASIPVVRIHRRVFDRGGRILEFCVLIDRADCYEFVYRFPLEE